MGGVLFLLKILVMFSRKNMMNSKILLLAKRYFYVDTGKVFLEFKQIIIEKVYCDDSF